MDEICQDDQWFEQAFTFMSQHSISLSNDKKLHFYGLFKQSTVGDINIDKPGLFEFVARAKWDAWKGFQGLSFRDARNRYIESVEALRVGWSRQGEYEPILSPEEAAENQEANGLGNVVSSLAFEPEDESNDIFGYARDNQLDQVKSALASNQQLLDTHDENGLSPLHYAVDRGHLDIVRYLLDQGANINLKTEDEETPLHLACISEQLEVARLLVQKGCDPSIKDGEGKTAFEQAESSFIHQL
ncbi:ankyrin repeat-containing domain protein [Sporodiniella umbellata]|nr:ankyrin repeat-containing domain protein [Sporodiniella umbellata]